LQELANYTKKKLLFFICPGGETLIGLSVYIPLLLIRGGASQVQFLFIYLFLQRLNLIGPSLQKKKKKTMEAPQNRRLYFEV
jgi:hypothetical protein